MHSTEHKLRVRYGETDKMGYVYYGNYAQYFEVARVECLRELGISYKKMEDDGIMLPVVNFTINYHKPAFYDDLLTIKTKIVQEPTSRIIFDYEVYNEKEVLLTTAQTTLVFIDIESNRPTRSPMALRQVFAHSGTSSKN